MNEGLAILLRRMKPLVAAEIRKLEDKLGSGDFELNQVTFGMRFSGASNSVWMAIISPSRCGLSFQRWGSVLWVSHVHEGDMQELFAIVLADGSVYQIGRVSDDSDDRAIHTFFVGENEVGQLRVNLREYPVTKTGLLGSVWQRVCSWFIFEWSLAWKGTAVGLLRHPWVVNDFRTCGHIEVHGNTYQIPLSRRANLRLQRQMPELIGGHPDRDDIADYLFPYPRCIGDDALICAFVHWACRLSLVSFTSD
ncbi:MAG: hypothetical protein NTZ32_07625 [Planctomycetales bacterium]|nr:hypothetical protein [Planctomycetales bacterium]